MRTVGFLFLLAAIAGAGEFVHKPSGLKLDVPEGWRRDSAREKGRIKFAGFLGIEQGKYVTFTVETVPITEAFEAAAWLEQQKRDRLQHLKQGTQQFTKDNDRSIGGVEAVGFTLSGVHEPKAGQAANLRFRAYAVVTGNHFFQFTEVSVNDAHKAAGDKLPAIWDGVAFQAAEGGDGEGGDGGAEAAEGTETPVEDTLGNYKTKLPPGWEVTRAAPTTKDVDLRMGFVRKDGDGNIVATVEVWRLQFRDSTIFHTGTPDAVVERLVQGYKFYRVFYGDGSHEIITAEVNEGVGFGGAEKTAEYVIRSKTMEEIAKIAAAETRVKRGEKGATVPKYLDLVVRGRVAMISPHVYVTRCSFRRSLADDAQIVAEYKSIHDNLEFLEVGAKPQPVMFGKDGKLVYQVGNTKDDPANAKARKEKTVYSTTGRKTYRMQVSYVLPPGFEDTLAKLKGKLSGLPTLLIVAQDKRNNWVRIQLSNGSHKKAGEQTGGRLRLVNQVFEEWKSNWTGKARGTKFPKKIQKFSLGKVRGKGVKFAEGKVENFHGTFRGVVMDKSGWRTVLEVETLAKGDEVFADGIKTLIKSIKLKPLK